MEHLPYDVLANVIVSLPFRDVNSLCNTDHKMKNFCLATTNSHQLIWKTIIQQTFGSLPEYEIVLEQLSSKYCSDDNQNGDNRNEQCYNYLIYINFIHQLDEGNQAWIYYQQKDLDSLDSLVQKVGSNNLLHSAIQQGHLDIVKYAVEHIPKGKEFGADIRSDYGRALTDAAKGGHLDIVKYLIERGADNNDGRGLIAAAEGGHIDIVKYFVNAGANIHTNEERSLNEAIKGGHYEVVKYLMEKGADIHVNNDYPLSIAAAYGQIGLVKYLVEEGGANVHAGDDIALQFAAEYGHLDIVKYLVNAGANIHVNDDQPLKSAERRGHNDIIRYINSIVN